MDDANVQIGACQASLLDPETMKAVASYGRAAQPIRNNAGLMSVAVAISGEVTHRLFFPAMGGNIPMRTLLALTVPTAQPIPCDAEYSVKHEGGMKTVVHSDIVHMELAMSRGFVELLDYRDGHASVYGSYDDFKISGRRTITVRCLANCCYLCGEAFDIPMGDDAYVRECVAAVESGVLPDLDEGLFPGYMLGQDNLPDHECLRSNNLLKCNAA